MKIVCFKVPYVVAVLLKLFFHKSVIKCDDKIDKKPNVQFFYLFFTLLGDFQAITTAKKFKQIQKKLQKNTKTLKNTGFFVFFLVLFAKFIIFLVFFCMSNFFLIIFIFL